MAFYPNLLKTSTRLLGKFGQTVTLKQYTVGGGDYNVATGKANPTTSIATSTIRKAIISDAPGKRIGPQYGVTREKNSLIQDTDKWIYLDANGAAPRLQDHIILDDIEFTIIDVQTSKPGGLALMYLLVLRA